MTPLLIPIATVAAVPVSEFLPHFQPLPFPAPVWLLNTLLIIGFYLHALPMNVLLAGGLTAAFLLWWGGPNGKRLGNAFAKSLPLFISVAITQGVVPLLFLQLVWGPLFYTSSILMGAFWMGLIGLLLVGYYAHYLFTYRRDNLGRAAPWFLVGANLLFLVIAFLFTNNTTLMLDPTHWLTMYRQSPTGANLNLAEPQLWPRYLHNVNAAVAVTGLTLGVFGLYALRRPDNAAYGAWVLRFGCVIFLLATLLQIVLGLWFLFSLPSPVQAQILGGDAMGTAVFMSSMALIPVSVGAIALAWKNAQPRPFWVGLGSTLVLIFLMVVLRHQVRVYMTSHFFEPQRVPVSPEWFLWALFAFSVVAGGIYLAWLIQLVWRAYHPPDMQPQFYR